MNTSERGTSRPAAATIATPASDSAPEAASNRLRPAPKHPTLQVARLWLLSLAAFAFTGCAGYKLGPTGELAAGEKTVQVRPFLNQTLEPRLGDAVTFQLRKELQRDGTYRLASRDDGDVIVSGVIVRYQRHEMSFVPDDVVTVRDYRVSLTAQVTARDRHTGKVLLDQPVIGYTLIRVGTDIVSTERQALPLLAADLAKRVTSLLSEGSW